jgi:hypothetical protein
MKLGAYFRKSANTNLPTGVCLFVWVTWFDLLTLARGVRCSQVLQEECPYKVTQLQPNLGAKQAMSAFLPCGAF